MASKRNRSAGTAQPSCSRNLGHNTKPCQSDGKRKLEKSSERAKKRRRTSQSHLENISGPTSRDADSRFVTTYTDNTAASTSTRTERIKRKRNSEETGGPSKKRKTTSSASKDPDNQAAKTPISSSSTRKPSNNSRMGNAGPSKPASTSTKAERKSREKNSEERRGPSKRRKTTSSASKDPDNQAAKTPISSSSTRKSSNNSRVGNAGPSKPASTSTKAERKSREKKSEERRGPSKRRKTTSSASKDPNNQAAKTAISSSSTRKPSINSRVCNAGPSKPATTSTRTERINRKRTSEETGGPSKRRKTTSSASKDPDNQAAKTAISSSSTRKPSINSRVCNAGPSKPATTSTRTERINRKRTSEETGGPSKRRKTTSSASKDPDNKAAKTAISSSSTRKSSINSRVCNAGPSKPASTKAQSKSRKNSVAHFFSFPSLKRTSSDSKDPDNQLAISNFQNSSNNSREDFKARYQEERFLGKGSFGSVFAGYRKEDNLPVAIKHIKRFLSIKVTVAGEITAMPSELAMLLKLSDKESSGVVKMHDWYHLEDELIIILERPDPCMDLNKYINSRELSLQEDEVKIITKQLVDAISEVHSIGVFHRDIKPANILIETGSDVPRVRLIDFGCAAFASEKRYTERKGTPLYQSPEWFKNGWYTAEGTNVWQLGVTIFRMLHNGCYPFRDSFEISYVVPDIKPSLSKDCQDFLRSCLTKILDDRPTMEMLKNHPWLM